MLNGVWDGAPISFAKHRHVRKWFTPPPVHARALPAGAQSATPPRACADRPGPAIAHIENFTYAAGMGITKTIQHTEQNNQNHHTGVIHSLRCLQRPLEIFVGTGKRSSQPFSTLGGGDLHVAQPTNQPTNQPTKKQTNKQTNKQQTAKYGCLCWVVPSCLWL